MSTTFALADLHGRYDLFELAVNHIEQWALEDENLNKGPFTLVTLGDYIDRGPASSQLITRLREGPRDKENWQWINLQGNHEAMMLATLTIPLSPNWWMHNGGNETMLSYGLASFDNIDGVDDWNKIRGDIAWLDSLPKIYVDEHRVFVHAWIDVTVNDTAQWGQSRNTLEHPIQWKLWPYNQDVCSKGGRHIVHGHEQSENHPLLLKNRTNLDTFAWYTGRLAVARFDDEIPGGPVEIFEIEVE